MAATMVPEAYPLTPADPNTRCSADDCARDGEDGYYARNYWCPEDLALVALKDEPIPAYASTNGGFRARPSDASDADAIQTAIAWAESNGRRYRLTITLDVDAEATLPVCEYDGPHDSAPSVTRMVDGCVRLLCMSHHNAEVRGGRVVA